MIAGLAPRKDRRPDALRRGWCPGALRPMSSGDGLIARLRIVGGAVTPTAARAIAEAAAKFGNGHIDLTSRGNLQIRGVGASTLAPLQSMLGALGLIDVEPAAEAVRNVMASPLAGFDPSALLDIRPSVTALDERLRSDRALWRLPAKFGFAIDDGGCLSVAREAAEITFSAVERDGRVQFSIRLAGRPAGLCEVDELSDEAARLACAFLQLRGSGEGAQRMAALVKGIGVEQIAHNAGLRFAAAELGDISEAPPPRPLGERHLGRFAALGVGAPFGRLDAARLAVLADAAEGTNGELRLTPWRAILIVGTDRSAAVAPMLRRAGFILEESDPIRSVAACPGAPACANGSTATQRDGARLAPLAQRLGAHGVALHVSGCAKGCAHARAAAVTLVGRDGRYDMVLDGRAANEPVLADLGAEELEAILERLGRAPRADWAAALHSSQVEA
ncbi:MAG: precorrin-3B synthase [Roseiarcus sp.]